MYQYKITLLKSKISEEDVKFRCSQDIAENSFIHHPFTDQDNDKEKLYVIILNIKNKVIGYSLVLMGSLTASIVHPLEVLKPAILASATSIIIIHNYPSGDPDPSNDDIEITNRISRASSIMGINLLDHIILGFEADEFKGYYSFKQKDLI